MLMFFPGNLHSKTDVTLRILKYRTKNCNAMQQKDQSASQRERERESNVAKMQKKTQQSSTVESTGRSIHYPNGAPPPHPPRSYSHRKPSTKHSTARRPPRSTPPPSLAWTASTGSPPWSAGHLPVIVRQLPLRAPQHCSGGGGRQNLGSRGARAGAWRAGSCASNKTSLSPSHCSRVVRSPGQRPVRPSDKATGSSGSIHQLGKKCTVQNGTQLPVGMREQ
jgi:hypothetical protein